MRPFKTKANLTGEFYSQKMVYNNTIMKAVNQHVTLNSKYIFNINSILYLKINFN